MKVSNSSQSIDTLFCLEFHILRTKFFYCISTHEQQFQKSLCKLIKYVRDRLFKLLSKKIIFCKF